MSRLSTLKVWEWCALAGVLQAADARGVSSPATAAASSTHTSSAAASPPPEPGGAPGSAAHQQQQQQGHAMRTVSLASSALKPVADPLSNILGMLHKVGMQVLPLRR